jgi:hypothetical protein
MEADRLIEIKERVLRIICCLIHEFLGPFEVGLIRNLHGKCWMVFENLCTYYTTKRLQIQWFKGVSGYSADTIYRDTIINAKFLAGATAVAIMIFSIGGIAAGFSMVVTGLIPTGEQIARLVIYLLLATVYICLWLAWAEFFSVVCRHAATAALACVAIWLVLTLFQSLIASGIASLVYPLTGANAQMNMLNNYQTQMAWNRVSPYYLFSEITSILMNPNVHSTNVISIMESQERSGCKLPDAGTEYAADCSAYHYNDCGGCGWLCGSVHQLYEKRNQSINHILCVYAQ